jgi:hypothetical protein
MSWIPRLSQNDTALVMLSEAKHPHYGFLACARNDTALVMLNEAQRSEASILDSSLVLGMTLSLLSC